jgi:hypothetical protein
MQRRAPSGLPAAWPGAPGFTGLLRMRGGSGTSAAGAQEAGTAPRDADGAACGTTHDGRQQVFVMGGFIFGPDEVALTDVVESYYAGSWRLAPSLPVATCGSRAETLQGSMYMMGGQDFRFLGQARANTSSPVNPADCVWPTLDTVTRLDASRGQWLPAPAMFRRRTCFGSAAIGGRIYVAGGFDGEELVRVVESFDPREPMWCRHPDLPRPRSAMAMSAVHAGGGSFLVACGGVSIPGGPSDAVDIFDIRKGAWIEGPPLLGSRSGAATATVDNKVYIVGGVGDRGPLAGVDVFDIRTLQWERDLSDSMSRPRTSLAAVTYRGKVMAIGGYDEEGNPVDTVEVYDPGQGWSSQKSLSFARGMFAAAVL